MASPTIREIFEEYWQDADARQVAAPKSLRDHAKHILIHFGAMPIDEFNIKQKQRVLKYSAHRRDEGGVSDSTINREIRNLRAALNFAERDEIIDRSQNKWLPKPQAGPPRDRVLSHESGGELDRVIVALYDRRTPARLRFFVLIALFTGQRKSAILQLRREHIVLFEAPKTLPDGTQSYGEIRFSKTQKYRTKKKRQDQPIHADLYPVIRGAIDHMRAPCDYVIQYSRRPMKDIRSSYQALLKRAGVAHATIHDLRRTAAQTVRDETDDLGRAARFIGDTEATTGSTYAKPKVEANLKAMDVIARKVARSRRGGSDATKQWPVVGSVSV